MDKRLLIPLCALIASCGGAAPIDDSANTGGDSPATVLFGAVYGALVPIACALPDGTLAAEEACLALLPSTFEVAVYTPIDDILIPVPEAVETLTLEGAIAHPCSQRDASAFALPEGSEVALAIWPAERAGDFLHFTVHDSWLVEHSGLDLPTLAEHLGAEGVDESLTLLADQNIRADVDRDGALETFLTIRTSEYVPNVLYGTYFVGGDGSLVTVSEEWTGPGQAEEVRFGAAIDLDGDGTTEAVVLRRGFESSSIAVHAMGRGGEMIGALDCSP